MDIFQDASRIMGERIGLCGTVTVDMTTTTVVLLGLVNTNAGDNTAFAGDRLIYVATDNTLQEASITSWLDSTGTATILNTTPAAKAGNAYILVAREDYTLNEYKVAFNVDLEYTHRTYRQVVPLTPNLDIIPLAMCDWLSGDGDVDAVWINESPVNLHNEDFALWQNGSASAPDGWTATGTVARVSGGIRSNYAASLVTGTLYQDMPPSLVQWITRRVAPVFTPIRGAAWVSNATGARVGIYDGSTTTWGDETYTGSAPHFLSVSVTPNATQTNFRLVLDGVGYYQATLFFQSQQDAPNNYVLRDQGSQGYYEHQQNRAIRNVGAVPAVELQSPVWTPWQLIVYVRRPFPVYDSDADVYEQQYKRVLVAGLVNFLLEAEKPSQDRARLDRIRSQQSAIWTRMNSNIVDLPVPQPPVRMEVWGA